MDDVTQNYGCTHSSPIHPGNKVSSLHWGRQILPSVFLQFFLEFTMVAKGVKLMALAEGISIRQYIDGWLIRTNSKQQCQENTQWLAYLVESLGWITKFLKLRFISNSRNQIFGYKFDLRVGLVFPTQKEIDRLLGRTFTMLKASHSSPGKLMSL